jgi:hypothetical protein
MHFIDELVKLIGPTGVIITLLTGPIGLLVSVVAIMKGLAERRKLIAEIEKLKLDRVKQIAEMPKIPREIRRLDFEAANLDAATFKIQAETSKIPIEVEKLKADVANAQALALNRIVAERERLNVKEIEESITQILDHADKINSELFKTYMVFFTAGASTDAIGKAHNNIIKFIGRDEHRTKLRGLASKLLELLSEIGQPTTTNIAHTVDWFGYTVSKSVEHDFPKMFENGAFTGSQEDIALIKSWVYDVRNRYERLSVLLNTVLATVQKRASQGNSPWMW